jgi:PIN domain nuclease of toxin-antitoxin system
VTPKAAPRCLLLDTCAAIWLVNAEPIPISVVEAIRAAGHADGVYVSIASAWEVGLLSRPKSRGKPVPQFWPDAKTWFARLMAMAGIKEAAITAAIAIDASYLPGDFHADPMDRLIVATARDRGIPVVTGDRKIIAYGQAGFVNVIAC